MSENTDTTDTRSNAICQIILAFLSFCYFLTNCHIDCSSALFASAFQIPLHTTGIYFTKLYSLRCLLMATGTLLEYIFYTIFDRISKSPNNRIYINLANLCLLLITRVVFAFLTHCSSQIAYHVYIILALEGFIVGSLTSLAAIVPGYSVVVTLGYNLCRVFIGFIQFILDLIWYGRPLFMIKIQCWLSVVLTTVAVGSWAYFINTYWNPPSVDKEKNKIEDNQPSGAGTQNPTNEVATFSETFMECLSPILMFPAGSIVKDFLFPGVLPYALLNRDKCHIINKVVTLLYGIGPMSLFIFEKAGAFDKWSSFYNGFWVTTVPVSLISIYTLMAIHTRIPSAARIRNSKPIVTTMTLTTIVYYSFFYALSFAGVPKVVHTAFKETNKIGDKTVITFNVICTMLYRFIFSKIAVGYNHTRVNLGYHLPKFRPNHRMSKSNLAWYFIRNTFRRAGHDTIEDFRMNIKDYL